MSTEIADSYEAINKAVSSAIVKAWYLRRGFQRRRVLDSQARFISHRKGLVFATSGAPARCPMMMVSSAIVKAWYLRLECNGILFVETPRFISHRHGFVMSTLRHSAIQQSINRFISHRHGFVMSTPGSTPFKKGADNGSSAIDTAL